MSFAACCQRTFIQPPNSRSSRPGPACLSNFLFPCYQAWPLHWNHLQSLNNTDSRTASQNNWSEVWFNTPQVILQIAGLTATTSHGPSQPNLSFAIIRTHGPAPPPCLCSSHCLPTCNTHHTMAICLLAVLLATPLVKSLLWFPSASTV